MHTVAHTVFRFEGYALDVTRGLLSADDREIPLRPKSFEVLRYLVENADRLVSKDELMQVVWPSVIVTDDSLKRCVSDVRLALGDGEQRIIKTVPRRGYVFAAPVLSSPIGTSVAFTPAPAPIELTGQEPPGARELTIPDATWLTSRKQRALAVLAGLILMLIAAAGAWYWRQPAGLPLPDRPSIAVLPFVNIGGDPEQDYFSDGMSEDLITSLSKFADLFVIARNSAFTYKGKQIDLSQIGRELGARYLVQGSVRRDADRLRITAQLVEGATGKQLWAERYDRELAGLFSVQDDVTQKIVVTLVAHVTKSERERVLRKPPESLAAYDYYLRANALMRNIHREKRGETIAAARQLYQRALDADPRYAPAVQGLAHTYITAWQELTSHEPIAHEYQQKSTLDRALLLAQSAVELDGNLAESHATLGFILRWQYRLIVVTGEKPFNGRSERRHIARRGEKPGLAIPHDLRHAGDVLSHHRKAGGLCFKIGNAIGLAVTRPDVNSPTVEDIRHGGRLNRAKPFDTVGGQAGELRFDLVTGRPIPDDRHGPGQVADRTERLRQHAIAFDFVARAHHGDGNEPRRTTPCRHFPEYRCVDEGRKHTESGVGRSHLSVPDDPFA